MSKEYIEKHVDEIMKDKEIAFPKSMAMASAWVLGNLKAVNLKVLDVSKTSSLSDYFVLCSATNFTQAQSMAQEVLVQLKRHDYQALSKEGWSGDSDWILLDMGDIIVHIFLEISRDVYDLDNLWSDSMPVEIPQEYYFSEEAETVSAEEKDYF
ncbi:MAG: ribosome silencing factor [Bacteriovoracaceae bacterium]|nr:ribosome silencing factor [Bacteriovoracaceae bacterium]